MKKSIAINSIFNILNKLLGIAFPLITSIYLARVLGPENVGKVAYAQSIMSYFLVVASLGIPTYGLREISRNSSNVQKSSKVFSELFLLNLGATFICSFAYSLLIYCWEGFSADRLLYICVGLTLYMNIFNIEWFYTGNEEYVYITVRSFIIKLMSLLALFVFIKKPSDYIIYALITSIATTGNYAWNMFNLRYRVKFQLHNLEFKKHLRPVMVLLMTMFATDLYNQLDVTMIGAICSETEVGLYSNGVKIVKTVYAITGAISATILPRMCLYYREKRSEQFQNLFSKTLNVVLLLALPCLLGIVLLAECCVKVLYGDAFTETAGVMVCLSPIIFIITVSYLFGSIVLTATNNEKYLLKATGLGVITNVILNILLIPLFSMYGAAIASVAGEFVVCCVHVYYGKKYVSASLNQKYCLSLFVALVTMSAVIVCVRHCMKDELLEMLTAVVVAAVVYGVVLLTMKNPIILEGKKILIDKFAKHLR